VCGLFKIGIWHDNCVVLGAAEALGTFAVFGCCRVDLLSDRGGTNKTKRLHIGVFDERVNGSFIAVDDLEHAVWHTGLLEQISKHQRDRWITLRWFQDESVASSQRRAGLPQRNHGWEVKR